MKLNQLRFSVVGISLAAFVAGCATVAPEPTIPKRTELLPLSEDYEDEDETTRSTAAAPPPPAPAPAPAPPPPAAGGARAEALGGAPPDKFIPGCPIPWDNAKHWEVSRRCPASGDADLANVGAVAEGQTKNFLCAQGPVVDLSLAHFKNLQQFAEAKAAAEGFPLSRGRSSYIRDRTTLKSVAILGGKTIGEGTVVRLVGYILSALTMNKTPSASGESVNCHLTGAEFNDIHIDVGPHPGVDACEGIVVEMIPHFRPITWTDENVRAITRPVRIIGQLFLDNRHRIRKCNEVIKGEPKRMSLWEIHPVYALDVCKQADLAWCDPKIDSRWVSLDTLAGSH
jgi:hypothetical protein